MNKILIALDNGHGEKTAGKRTPIFPVGHKYAGTFMKEYHFNKSIVDKLSVHLERCGFDVLLTSPTDYDTPLKKRTDLANNTIRNKFNRRADILISIHANALTGKWGSQNGTETLWTKRSDELLAQIIHDHILKGTKLTDRKCKPQNLHMTRESDMPACLPEVAFMDNLNEAELLMSDEFRSEHALDIARGVCEYFGRTFIDELSKVEIKEDLRVLEIQTITPVIQRKVAIVYDGRTMNSGLLIDNTTFVPLRKLGELLGFLIGWDEVKRQASFNGIPIEKEDSRLVDSTTYIKLRKFLQLSGYKVIWDSVTYTATIKNK